MIIEKIAAFFDFLTPYEFLGHAHLNLKETQTPTDSSFFEVEKWHALSGQREKPIKVNLQGLRATENLVTDAPVFPKSGKNRYKHAMIFRKKTDTHTEYLLCLAEPLRVFSLMPSDQKNPSDQNQIHYEALRTDLERSILRETSKSADVEAPVPDKQIVEKLLRTDFDPLFLHWMLAAFGYEKHPAAFQLKMIAQMNQIMKHPEAKKNPFTAKDLTMEGFYADFLILNAFLNKLFQSIDSTAPKKKVARKLPLGKKGIEEAFRKMDTSELKRLLSTLANQDGKGADKKITMIIPSFPKNKTKAPKKDKEDKEDKKKQGKSIPKKYLHTQHFIEIMNRRVVGQTEAKNALAVILTKHFRRLKLMDRGIEIEKTNLLMVGPSGTGKTSLIKTITENLDIPYIKIDANSLTQTGYVGRNVSDVLISLLQKENYNIKRAEKAILVIDEIDKIRSFSDDTLEVSNRSVQSELLSIIDGEDVYISDAQTRSKIGTDRVSTHKMLVICLGAFAGMDAIIRRRMRNHFGFRTATSAEQKSDTEDYALQHMQPQDLKAYGFLSEFVGRLHTTTYFRKLREEDYLRILRDTEQSMIKQLQEDFKLVNVSLNFEPEALEEIAKHLQDDELGARQIKSTFSKIMRPYYLQEAHTSEEPKEVLVSKEEIINVLKTQR